MAGGIAAYKVVEVLRGLSEAGLDVTVVPTQAALRFVGEPTWAALSGRPVVRDLWSTVAEVPHVRLGQEADLVLVAPATADLLARATHGIATDVLTNVMLATRAPLLIAPAMHTEMWCHPATQRNVALLRDRGAIVLEPAAGRLTGSDSGPGRLPDPGAIVDAALRLIRGRTDRDLSGLRVVVTAGGTREAWDPVRYLGNRSSGRQGVALARAAVARGAVVTLIGAAMEVPAPAGVALISVRTAEQMRQAVRQAMGANDVLVMAAAVADFRPAVVGERKIKKGESADVPELVLERTVDVLAEVAAERRASGATRPVLVGFAAETQGDAGALEALGVAKLAAKGCDMLVVNDVGGGSRPDVFGSDRNDVLLVGSTGVIGRASGSKDDVSDAIWDAVLHHCAAQLPGR